MAVLGRDALGMKLHSVHGEAAMGNTHDRPIVGFGDHCQIIRQGGAVNHERMVAGRLERPVDAANTPSPRCLICESLPCTGTGARTTSPPKTCPIA